MEMTALQKLVRVVEIKNAIHRENDIEQLKAYGVLLDEVLDGVSLPPQPLIGNPDPQAWADAFEEHFGDSITAPSCYAWLSNAMLAGAQAAQGPSYEAGRAEGLRQAKEGFNAMADLLAFIRAGVDAGKIRSPFLTDPMATPSGCTPDAVSLAELCTRRLRLAGQE